MIDRDDREGDRDGDDRSQVEHNQAETTPADGTANGDESTPADEAAVADEAPREGPAPEEQPAMQLAGGSDEGGTVSEAGEPQAEQPEADDGVEDASEDAVDEGEPGFDGNDLGLVSDDDALPWLESSDYEEIESVDAWRVTGFVVLGLVLLALLVGGIWYFTDRTGDNAPQADGSVIAAPEGPYKERPENPGGKTFEGTGDMAPAVGEGESREGRLAEKSATPEPIAEPSPAKEPEAESSASAASDNRIAVQVGAYRDQATARAGWAALRRQTDALSGVEYRIVKGEADIGTVYRLQALPGDMAAARRLRDALQADGVASQIKR
ncbi:MULTISPECIES: SPOR domain-containing protein [Citromicrobium]|uniref:SPOR domain-containing protein n=1 Tax=Citromicrobium TaxID=72173 RepID=UPI0001DD0686|nr:MULTISPECIES: SPOR domain-containing protein [Citromicrobium]